MKQNLKCFFITVFLIAIYSIHLHASDLKWDASTGDVSGYKIYYGLSQGSYPFSEDVGNVTQYSLNNLSLSESSTYYFVVRAYNATGESGDSNVISYTVPSAGDTTPPLPPTGVSGEIRSEDILLTWQENSETDISGYRVYYGTSTRNYGLPISVEATQYSISGLNMDVPYYFAVTAVDTSGNESGYSSPEIIKTISIVNDIEGSMLKWGAATGEVSGYKIYFGTSEGNYTENIDVGNVTQYSLTNLSLTIGQTYYFVVRAYNDYGESLNSNVVTYSIKALEDTAAPVIAITSPTTETFFGTKSASISLGGTASDAMGVTQVIWSNSKGGSGSATGTDNWSVVGVSLVEGENVITVTASDEAGNTSTDTLTIEYTIPDTTSPVVLITSPTTGATYGTKSASLEISGTASDAIGVTQVSWSNSRGGSGSATGTDNWSVDIFLAEGENVLTVTASDGAGNTSTDTLSVVYTIPDTTSPSISIKSPTDTPSFDTSSLSLNISGSASDNEGVTEVVWSNSAGGSGTATGTDSWSISNIALVDGVNVIAMTARDAAGNESTDKLIVTNTLGDLRTKVFGAVSGADFPQTCEDTYLNAGAADTNTANNTVSLNTYTWPSDTAANRVVMNWDVSVLPKNAVVLKAKLSMYMYDSGGDEEYEITAHKIINNKPVVSNCTWNTYDGTNSWTGGNNGGEQDLAAAEVSVIVDKNVGYKEFDITEMVKNWIADPASNFGLMLNSDSIASSDSNRYFRPSEYSDPDMRPRLIIEYYGLDVAPADTTAPVVTITSPTTEISHGVESESLNLEGTASDAVGVTQVAWSNSRGGSGIATGTTSWSAGLTLAEGENVITVTARDGAGNESTDFLTVVYTIPDTTAPVVTITAPTAGTDYSTLSASLNMAGTASDAIGVTQVAWTNSRGGSGTATGTTSWSAGLTLAEGDNVITVTARDGAGNESTDVLTVVYTIPDTTAPVVTITAPTTGSSYGTISASLNMAGTASDAVGVTQVAWTNSRGGSGTATGTTSWSAGLTLAEGDNVITVTARDGAGNESTDVLTVVYTIPDTTAPVVTITAPATDTRYSTASASLNLGGTASDAVGVTQVTWTNSRGGSGTATGTTSWSAGLTLADGNNVITVTARDAAGNESSDSILVIYSIPDTQAPSVALSQPTSGGTYFTRSATVNLAGSASDNVGVKQVTWVNSKGGSGVASGTTSWSVSNVSLARWWNTITITAVDNAGNETSRNLTVFSWR